jgi:hypothetical protein
MDTIIKKNGILVDKDTNKELTPSYQYLFDTCEIDNDVTLKDIFLLLNKDITMYHSLLGNWLSEIVTEGLSKEGEGDKDIEYLELHWNMEKEVHKGSKNLYGFHFPQFHGVSHVAIDDIYEGEILLTKQGERTSYAIEMTPTYKLMNIPVKLKKGIFFEEWKLDRPVKREHIDNYADADYTLANILYGIIFELSFFGSPSDRDGKTEEIKKSIEEINEKGVEATCVTWEELEKSINTELE